MLAKGSLCCILAAVLLVSPALSANVKGVAPEKQALYHVSGNTWTCLDKSKTIPASAINDDYCDCPDGSDEPGTSACPNSYFYCENKGHIPSYIKSYRVNDGVCDPECCDGSDETSGLIKCDNICNEMGAQYRKHKAEMDAILSAGATSKREWIAYGQSKVADLQTQKAKLEEQLAIMRKELEELQKTEDSARAHEQSLRASTVISSNSDSKPSQCPPCKSVSDGAVLKIGSLKNHIRNLQDEVDELLTILHDMKRDHNQNYHDLAVKSAISGYDEFLVDYDIIKAERQQDVDETEIEDELIAADENQEESFTNEEPEEESDPQVKEAVQAVTEASNAVQNHNTEISNKESELRGINDQLNKDYGRDLEWMKLDQQCFEKDEGEYVYSICMFGSASQKSNRDGANTNLGAFERFAGSSNSHHPDYYSQQLYSHGTKCWNGPERSVRAVFECGGQTEILEVTEPEKCEYQFKMRTPAVCPLVPTKGEEEAEARVVHEEL